MHRFMLILAICISSYFPILSNKHIEHNIISTNRQNVTLKRLNNQEAKNYCNDIARIRLTLFKEYPYLYDGTLEIEQDYLENVYFKSPRATIILVFDEQEVVGFSSSIPLTEEMDEVKLPFINQGVHLDEYLYIGEVMLNPAYRSKGILKKFAEIHESKARELCCKYMLFATVDRDENHTYKPADYKNIEPICKHFGFKKVPNLIMTCSWMRIDTQKNEDNILHFWQKSLKQEQQTMVTITSLEKKRIQELKEFILRVAYDTWQPKETFDNFSDTFYQSNEFRDIENFETVYTNNHGTFLLVLDKDTIIGSGAIKRINDTTCELKRMFIDTTHHRKGLGSKLFLELLDFARLQNYKKIRLELWQPTKQEAAIKFYEKLGFKEFDPYVENNSGKMYMELNL